MKKVLFFLLFIGSSECFSQAYIPMPSSDASWRYRSVINDNLVLVNDFLVFLSGTDTTIRGNTYHRISSRSSVQNGTLGFNPPVVAVTATQPDVFFGGIRESGQKIYYTSGGAEQLIFDFTATVGSYIPASSGTIRVVSIDSILIGSYYHKRYNTTDTTYYVIEGVGSSRGLIPGLDDGSGLVIFHCFTHAPDTWSPDISIPCTYIYPFVYGAGVKPVSGAGTISVYPNPVNNELHINYNGQDVLQAAIVNCIGQKFWQGTIDHNLEIPVAGWPSGIYLLQYRDGAASVSIQKIVVESGK